jgi:toxin ParE1/3/4
MAKFHFTRRAESDLLEIGNYTIRTRDSAQAARYLGELKICCQSLADNPSLGRLCEYFRPGLHRFEHRAHVVFYAKHHRGILIVRILHRSMLPEKHPLTDQNGES